MNQWRGKVDHADCSVLTRRRPSWRTGSPRMKPGLSRRSANSVTGGWGGIFLGRRGSWKQGRVCCKQRNMCCGQLLNRIKVTADVEIHRDPPLCCVYATTDVNKFKFRQKSILVRSWMRSCSGSPERMSALSAVSSVGNIHHVPAVFC